MAGDQGNSKRIVTNTIVLYIRMFIVMLISLYSSRLVHKALGVDDFGLFNLVGSVVALMTFLKSTLASSTQRFLSFELGRDDSQRLSKVFSVSLTTHVVMAAIILLLAETIGLWFLHTKVNIPEGRKLAADIIYQLSVFSLLVSVIALPYIADVISHEKMTFYAVVGVAEAVLKLFFAYLLLVIDTDKLILYGILTALLQLLVNLSFGIYCRIKFKEARFRLAYDKTIFREIFSFSGWALLGQAAVVAVSYGTGIVVNWFYPLAVNAAMGIAHQVNGAITGLTSNFQTAFQPQITKSYAAKDYEYMDNLIAYTSKISFFLLFIVTYPIMMNIDYILNLWLTTVPEYTNWFCILFIIASIFNALSAPLWIAVFATGKIKQYQITVSTVFFSDLIIVYFLFKLGFPPVTCMVVKAIINFIVIFVRILFAKKEVECFSAALFIKNAVLPCLISALLAVALTLPFYILTSSVALRLAITLAAGALSILSAYWIGLNQAERQQVKKMFLSYLHIHNERKESIA